MDDNNPYTCDMNANDIESLRRYLGTQSCSSQGDVQPELPNSDQQLEYEGMDTTTDFLQHSNMPPQTPQQTTDMQLPTPVTSNPQYLIAQDQNQAIIDPHLSLFTPENEPAEFNSNERTPQPVVDQQLGSPQPLEHNAHAVPARAVPPDNAHNMMVRESRTSGQPVQNPAHKVTKTRRKQTGRPKLYELRRIAKQMNASLISMEQFCNQQEDVRPSVTREQHVRSPAALEESVQSPTAREECVESTKTRAECVQSSTARDECVESPQTRAECVRIPTAREEYIHSPQTRAELLEYFYMRSPYAPATSQQPIGVQQLHTILPEILLPNVGAWPYQYHGNPRQFRLVSKYFKSHRVLPERIDIFGVFWSIGEAYEGLASTFEILWGKAPTASVNTGVADGLLWGNLYYDNAVWRSLQICWQSPATPHLQCMSQNGVMRVEKMGVNALGVDRWVRPVLVWSSNTVDEDKRTVPDISDSDLENNKAE